MPYAPVGARRADAGVSAAKTAMRRRFNGSLLYVVVGDALGGRAIGAVFRQT